jgi:hypothetical protein
MEHQHPIASCRAAAVKLGVDQVFRFSRRSGYRRVAAG